MQLFCSKCEKPVAVPDVDESVDGFIYSCPECDGPLLHVPYDEADKVYQRLATEMVLGIDMSEKCIPVCGENEFICDDCRAEMEADPCIGCVREEDTCTIEQCAEIMKSCECAEPCEPDGICDDCCCGLVSEEILVLPGFTKDEALYLLHITDKQLGKVNNAANQLINIKTKLGGYTK